MRTQNFSVDLAIYGREILGKPFVWGETDCASIARRALEIIHGEDLLDGKIRNYTTKTGAVRAFNDVGSFEEILASIGGIEVPVKMIQDGDIVFVKKEHEEEPYQNAGFAIGKHIITANPELGIIQYRKADLRFNDTYTAYRVS